MKETELSEGDVVRLEYTARNESGQVVDTTDPKVAEDARFENVGGDGPVAVIVGEEHVFEPVEEAVVAAGVGGTGEVSVPPDEGFGDHDPEDRIEVETDRLPEGGDRPGARVEMEGRVGHVDNVEDGRALVDFNHPLAGETVEYEFRVVERIDSVEEMARALAETYGLNRHGAEVSVEDGELVCSVRNPDETWDDAKRGYVEDVLEHVGVESVRIDESYRA